MSKERIITKEDAINYEINVLIMGIEDEIKNVENNMEEMKDITIKMYSLKEKILEALRRKTE